MSVPDQLPERQPAHIAFVRTKGLCWSPGANQIESVFCKLTVKACLSLVASPALEQ